MTMTVNTMIFLIIGTLFLCGCLGCYMVGHFKGYCEGVDECTQKLKNLYR